MLQTVAMSDWVYETFDEHTRLGLRVKEKLFEGKSRFQKVEVIDAVSDYQELMESLFDFDRIHGLV